MNKVITITCIALFCATAASAQTVPATQNGKTKLENATSNLGPHLEINRQFFIYSPVIVNRKQQFKLCFRLMTLSG